MVWLVTTALWFSPGFVRPDAVGVYAYLPSSWIDHDFVFYDEWRNFGQIENGHLLFGYVTSSGHLGVQYTCGTALVLYPAFVLGDVARLLVPRLSGYARNGISLPYAGATAFMVALLGLGLLWLGYRLARRWFGPFESALAVVGIWLGSPLMWYALEHSLMPHAASAFACALTVWLSLELRDDPGHVRAVAVGLSAGLAFAIRPQDGPFLLVPFFLTEGAGRRRMFGEWFFLGLGFGIAALPQLITSWFILGTPWEFVHIESPQLGGAFTLFQRFWVWEPFLSFYHGMFTWTPLLAFGVVGIFLLRRFDRGLFRAALFSFIVQWLVNSTLDRAFWGAYAFGQRRYLNLTIFLLLGLAATFASIMRAFERISVRARRVLCGAIAVACVAWTMSLFFAMLSSLDPNAYYLPGELFARQVDAIAGAARFFVPLARVPASARGDLLLVATIVGVACGLAMLLLRRRSLRARVALASAVLIALSGFFVFCGFNDASHLERYSSLIQANQGDPAAISARARLRAILGPEYAYLVKSGRLAEAARTKRDIEALERVIREHESR